ncbi:hypothetical protein GCM10023144_16530 [Pigmentiphaga soli]|uniref:Fluoroacetyl-CoA-specific thioesterase-like domain-containing protein n=1 Tax=Pigmentiphaga soli TaxID=1007095 RepID=A0ABP8GUA6_9BURK
MRAQLSPGLAHTARMEIDAGRTISFMGDAFRIYATPSMARDVESTCRELLQQYLDEGENSVGARIELDHLGPTLLGMWVDVEVRVTEVDGRRVAFEAEVRDALDTVGRARHVRFVVSLDKQRERLAAKAQRVAAAAGGEGGGP